jgi:nicotinamidase-related amidase
MKKTLIVVDMQNDFIDMALGTPEAVAIVPRVKAKIQACRDAGYEIIYTRDTHGTEYLSTPEGKKLPVEHCIRGTHGWELNPEVEAALEGCERIEKPGFGSPRLPERVAQLSGDGENLTIEVIGLCTDICVVCNAMLLKARFPEATMRLLRSCCAGVTPELHEAALKTMASCQIEIV